jgi:hypothetical protein
MRVSQEHTLNLLYTAQQSIWRQASPNPEQNWQQTEQSGQDEQNSQTGQTSPDDFTASHGQHGMGPNCPGANQRSLHSFWSLTQTAVSRQHPPSVVAAGGFAPAAGTRAHGGEEDSVMDYAG